MTQEEMSRFYRALADQSLWMADAIESFEKGVEHTMWFSLIMWIQSKHLAKEIADAHDTMSFAKAMGVADGIRKAWE